MNPNDFVRDGISVIPVLPRSKQPEVRWQKYQTQLPTAGEMLRWFRPGRQTNAAVVCGWQGLTVLDFDAHSDYIAWYVWALTTGGVARDVAHHTYRVRTSRGMHVYVRVDETPRCGKAKAMAGELEIRCDIKGRGGYVLIPPSIHPSGAVYTALNDGAPIVQVGSLGNVLPEDPGLARQAVELPPLVYVFPTSSLWPKSMAEEIKERIPIVSLFADLRGTGGRRWYVAHCPLHEDKHESMWIDAERGLCACYAGCNGGKAMDVIALYAQLHHLTNKAAYKELCRQVAA